MKLKISKILAAMTMCVAFAVVSCLPVSAAEYASCRHLNQVVRDCGYGGTITENGVCRDCTCVSCPAKITYRKHNMASECVACGHIEYYTILEQESHICGCTTCECICSHY